MDRRRAAALLALAAWLACIACTAAAPYSSDQTSLDLYDGPVDGCYYNFQHYREGDRIMTNEPCLNCTCHNRMLMCYLRVCPFTKAIGQDCTVEKRADQCCPIVTCPDVPVDLLTSTSTSSPAEYGGAAVGKLDKYGCSINGKYFPEGSKVPPTPNKPCEHCYCIRNMTTCVMQECTLHVDGCTPIYHKDVCCPVRYSCDHPEDEIPLLDDLTTTVRPTPGFLLTTTTLSPVTQVTQDCVHDDQIFPDGALIKTQKACEHCYCMKGDIVCVVQECGTPMENEGKNCTSLPPRDGQCCPDTYICEGDEHTTELISDLTTESEFEATTPSPPRRVSVEGSGYRDVSEEAYTEIPTVEPEIEGSGEEQKTPEFPETTDIYEKGKPHLHEDTSTLTPHLPSITDAPEAQEPHKLTTEVDEGLNTVPSGFEDISEPSVVKVTQSEEEEHITTAISEAKETTVPERRVTSLPDSSISRENEYTLTTEPTYRKDEEIIPTKTSSEKDIDTFTTISLETTQSPEHEEKITTEMAQSTMEHEVKSTTVQLPEYTDTHEEEIKQHELTTESLMEVSGPSDVTSPVKEQVTPEEATTKSTVDLSVPSDVTSSVDKTVDLQKLTTESILETSTPSERIPSKDVSVKLEELTTISTIEVTGRPEATLSVEETVKPQEATTQSLETFGSTDVTLPVVEAVTSQELATETTPEVTGPSDVTAPAKEASTPQGITTESLQVSSSTDVSPLVDKEAETKEPTTEIVEDSSPSLTTSSLEEISKPHEVTTVSTPELFSPSDETVTSDVSLEEAAKPQEATTESILETSRPADVIASIKPQELTTESTPEISGPSVTTTPVEEAIKPHQETTEPVEPFGTTDVVSPLEEAVKPQQFTTESIGEVSGPTETSPLIDEELPSQEPITEPFMEYSTPSDKTSLVIETVKPQEEATESPSSPSDSTQHVKETPGTTPSELESEDLGTTLTPEKLDIPETTSLRPEESARIPGEGDCLVDGITYKNNSDIPNHYKKCQSGCKCVSSIVLCNPIICSPPPENTGMSSCKQVYDTMESCCPTYVCDDSRQTIPPESHSHVSGTEIPIPTTECNDDECQLEDDKKPKPDSAECGIEGCKEAGIDQGTLIPPGDCTEGKCETLPTKQEPCDKESGCDLPAITPCEGELCKDESDKVSEKPTPLPPCNNEEDCKRVQIPDIHEGSCNGEECKGTVPIEEVPGGCENEDDCKVKPSTPSATTCEGDDCKTVPSKIEIDACDNKEDCITFTKTPDSELPPECENDEDCKGIKTSKPDTTSCKDDKCETPLPETQITVTKAPEPDKIPCEGNNCKGDSEAPSYVPQACDDEENCKDIKTPEIACEGENCKTDVAHTISEECKEEVCKKQPVPSIERKPAECKGSDCLSQPTSPESASITESPMPEYTIQDVVTSAEEEPIKRGEELDNKSTEPSTIQELDTGMPETEKLTTTGLEQTNEVEKQGTLSPESDDITKFTPSEEKITTTQKSVLKPIEAETPDLEKEHTPQESVSEKQTTVTEEPVEFTTITTSYEESTPVHKETISEGEEKTITTESYSTPKVAYSTSPLLEEEQVSTKSPETPEAAVTEGGQQLTETQEITTTSEVQEVQSTKVPIVLDTKEQPTESPQSTESQDDRTTVSEEYTTKQEKTTETLEKATEKIDLVKEQTELPSTDSEVYTTESEIKIPEHDGTSSKHPHILTSTVTQEEFVTTPKATPVPISEYDKTVIEDTESPVGFTTEKQGETLKPEFDIKTSESDILREQSTAIPKTTSAVEDMQDMTPEIHVTQTYAPERQETTETLVSKIPVTEEYVTETFKPHITSEDHVTTYRPDESIIPQKTTEVPISLTTKEATETKAPAFEKEEETVAPVTQRLDDKEISTKQPDSYATELFDVSTKLPEQFVTTEVKPTEHSTTSLSDTPKESTGIHKETTEPILSEEVTKPPVFIEEETEKEATQAQPTVSSVTESIEQITTALVSELDKSSTEESTLLYEQTTKSSLPEKEGTPSLPELFTEPEFSTRLPEKSDTEPTVSEDETRTAQPEKATEKIEDLTTKHEDIVTGAPEFTASIPSEFVTQHTEKLTTVETEKSPVSEPQELTTKPSVTSEAETLEPYVPHVPHTDKTTIEPPTVVKEEGQVTEQPLEPTGALEEITEKHEPVTEIIEVTQTEIPEQIFETKIPESGLPQESLTESPEIATETSPISEQEEYTERPEPQESSSKKPEENVIDYEEKVTHIPESSVTHKEHITETPEGATTKEEERQTEMPALEITTPKELYTPTPQQIFTESVGVVTDVEGPEIKTPSPYVPVPESLPTETSKPPSRDQETTLPEVSYTTLKETGITEAASPVTESQETITQSPEAEITEEIRTGSTILQEPVTESQGVFTEKAEPSSELPVTESDLTTESKLPVSQVTEPQQIATKAEEPVTSTQKEQGTESPYITEKVPDKTETHPHEPGVTESHEYVTKTPSYPTEYHTDAEVEKSTERPEIQEQTSEPQYGSSETTPYLVELEEHTHKLETESPTLRPEAHTTSLPEGESEASTELRVGGETERPKEAEDKVPEEKEKLSTPAEETLSPELYATTVPAYIEGPQKTTKLIPVSADTTLLPVTDTEGEVKYTTEAIKEEEQEKVSEATAAHPSHEEHSTVSPIVPETEKSVPPEIDVSGHPEKETIPITEKPLETKKPAITTVSEEEYAATTTKDITPKPAYEASTELPHDKYTKPEPHPSELYPPTPTPASEIPKPPQEIQPVDEVPPSEDEGQFPHTDSGYGHEPDYMEEDQAFGPGTCRYGGKVYVSAQQIPRDDPCDFCFCFRSDIICLQQSCPPPIHGCHEEPIQGFCCPRYECPVSMATTLNVTTTTTTTTTTLPPHFPLHAYKGAAQRQGCQIKGHTYKVGEVVRASSGPCLHCTCGGDGQMKCDPKACTPEPMLRQMIAAAVSAKRRR